MSALYGTYARSPLAFERGEGPWLITPQGDKYLDFTSGVAVNALGHAHPALVKAITDQAQKVWHVSNLYRIPEGERLAAYGREVLDRGDRVLAEIRGETAAGPVIPAAPAVTPLSPDLR